jgi:hypothetical protein
MLLRLPTTTTTDTLPHLLQVVETTLLVPELRHVVKRLLPPSSAASAGGSLAKLSRDELVARIRACATQRTLGPLPPLSAAVASALEQCQSERVAWDTESSAGGSASASASAGVGGRRDAPLQRSSTASGTEAARVSAARAGGVARGGGNATRSTMAAPVTLQRRFTWGPTVESAAAAVSMQGGGRETDSPTPLVRVAAHWVVRRSCCRCCVLCVVRAAASACRRL